MFDFTRKRFLSIQLLAVLALSLGCLCQNPRRPGNNRNRPEKIAFLRDAFYEDNAFVVRIKTTYNQTSSITCNAVAIEDQLVLSDVTCIKYQGMANIDAKFVQVIAGDNDTPYPVDQIYVNKADVKDPGTELAVLKLGRPIQVDTECRRLIKPERNHSIEPDTKVRVIGYTHGTLELKENRTRVAKRLQTSKYICTTPADHMETPGSVMLKGAPLLQMVDCKQYQLVGIFTKTETVPDSPTKKSQDCYVMVSTQMRWMEQVKSLASLASRNDGLTTQPSVMVVSVDDPSPTGEASPDDSIKSTQQDEKKP